jgi:SAM-dependent methyltransferase
MTLRGLFSRPPRPHARPGHRVAPADGLSHNRACNLEDFEHPELRAIIRDVFAHEIRRFGPEFPRGCEYRKHWEIAMAVRALRDLGALHRGAQVLGIAAGNEPTIFWLTAWVGRVFATDLYLDAGAWTPFAHRSMLADPGAHWPGPWEPRRLVVQHMNALDLMYEDESFDAIFSSSSIEHFGTPDDVRRAAAEMFRVLRPGGILSLSTEFRLEGPPPGLPGMLLLDERDIRDWIIGDLAWAPVSPLDLAVSPATRRREPLLTDYLDRWHQHFCRHGQAVWHQLDFDSYPQLLLRSQDHLFTSVHIALRKD